jgi:PAS domain S-box-containing protein
VNGKRARREALLTRRPSALRFATTALIGPAILLGLLLWLNLEFRTSEALRVRATTSLARRLVLTDLMSSLKDAETAQRGYVLTGGDPAFLTPFAPAVLRVRADLKAAREQADEAHELPALDRIDALVTAKFAEMDAVLANVRPGDVDKAAARVRAGVGRRIMDELRARVGHEIDEEARHSDEDTRAFLAHRATTQQITIGAALLAAVMISALFVAGWRLRRARYVALVRAFEAAERNETILDSTVDAMLILNPSGSIETMNAAATTMLGYAPDELERRDIATVIDLAPGEGSFHHRIGLIDGHLRRNFLADRTARHRNGRTIAVDVAIGVMVVPSGDHLVVSLRDVTERKRLEQMKDDLMSTVSHELRTPLTSIVGSLGLLRAGSAGVLPKPAGRLLSIAENNSRRLIRLINDMLDIDRIESGVLEMHREAIDLRPVVERAGLGAEGLAASRNIAIVVDTPPAPVIVSGDADRLLQVITNLMSNAIRFTPAGGSVTLGLALVPDGQVMVTVDDQGPGVPPGFRERIFGRFERAAGEAGAQGGAGLGLAISREIVLRHDGRIWFEDLPYSGTRFAFALDRMRPASMRESSAVRVLICEQDQVIAGRLIAMVVKEGCAYEVARDAAAARAILADSVFDVLLIDLNLPGEGGLAFARSMREQSPPISTPIIITATEARGDEDSPGALDVVDWIQKPVALERLTDALRRALSRAGRSRPTVLHLDDDADLLQVVAAALEPETRILTATDLSSARAILESISPDVAILDLRLADGSGLDLIPFLVDANGLAIPTIIYSAQDVSVDLASQVDAVLVKARGSLPDLKATLRRVVRARDTEGPLR